MFRVPNRTIPVIDYLIKHRVEEGTILVTDKARVYQNIETRLGIPHYSVNHSENFICPRNLDVNTQMIESHWAQLKKKFKTYKKTHLLNNLLPNIYTNLNILRI